MEFMYDVGVNIVLLFQNLGEWLLVPMKVLSFLGSPEFYLLVMPFLYWSIDAVLGIRIGIILFLSAAFNYYLKVIFHTGRPFWVSREVESYAYEYDFAIPSGHAQLSSAYFGLLAASLKRRWVWALSLVLIFLIGISRIYLAVHFPQDVILGWCAGFLLLWIFLRVEDSVGSWFSERSLPMAVLVLFAASMAMLLTGFLLRSVVSSWQIPAAWIENARLAFPEEELFDPLKISKLMLASGAFFGFSSGAVWLSRRGGFDAKGRWLRRITRYLVGVIGVAALWFGLGSLLPEQAGIQGYILNYALYAVIGLWISALAPLIFLKLNLANPQAIKNPAA